MATLTEAQERNWGMFCHLAALIGYVMIPLGNVIGPLVVWLIKKDESEFVADQGKESLNFQISICIYATLALLLVIILVGFFLLGVVWVFGLVMVIVATVKASKGEKYRYPLTLRLIK